jgi:hypothetical protein
VTANPWNRKHRAVLAAGSRGFGSIGLLHYIKTQELLQLVVNHKNFVPGGNFIAVFSFSVNHVCSNTYGFSNLICEELARC